MIEAMIEGLLHINPLTLALMSVAVVFSTMIAVIPGLGGIFALVLVMPFTFTLDDPIMAVAILVSITAVTGNGDSVTGILFGAPGSPTGLATVFDGYPMAQNGEAGRAIGAALTAAAVGGVIGAMVLAALIPIVRPLVLLIGPAEFTVLIGTALVFVSTIGGGDTLRSMMAGALGLAVSLIGQEPSTAALRYTGDWLYLFGGIRLVPLMIGLFAVAEMISLTQQSGSIANVEAGTEVVDPRKGMKRGVLDVFRYWRATLESSLTGLGIGIVPGMGGDVASLLAYSRVSRFAKEKDRFGQGVVEGVIASDAAQNSKSGGAFVPTLAFGVPGSASMAILLSAFASLGFFPGEAMLTTDLDIFWLVVWALVIANILATVLILVVVKPLAQLTFVKTSLLVPPILAISLYGSFAATNHVGDILTVAAAGLAGYAMMALGYSRTTFVIGFVLGAPLERQFLLTQRLYGWTFIERPGVQIILAIFALSVLIPLIRRVVRRREGAGDVPAATPRGDEVE